MGNYKDTLMEQLADKGNGNNYYIDSLDAAKRVFAEQLTATLEVAAKDVKLQVEFDPAQVERYRLIGYENRDIADKDFRKDSVGAGQVGWGHQVSALYEVELTAAAKARPAPLGTVRIRHKSPESIAARSARSDDRAHLAGDASLRDKQPEADAATEAAFAMDGAPASSLASASADLRFAFAVAAFADVMRGGAEWSLDDIRAHAAATAGADKDRSELVSLIDRARSLRGNTNSIATDPATTSMAR
jgi:Ca-activated chloride channel family protein